MRGGSPLTVSATRDVTASNGVFTLHEYTPRSDSVTFEIRSDLSWKTKRKWGIWEW
jgi:hypothetical protein